MIAGVKCPKCGLMQMASPTCKGCGTALGGPAPMAGPPPTAAKTPVAPSPSPVQSPPEEHYKARKQRNLGLGLIGLGLVFEVPLFYLDDWRGGVLLWIAMGLCGVGLGYYAKAKRRSLAWCAMALFPVIGPPLGLLALRGQAQMAPRQAAPRQTLLAGLSLLCALIAWAVLGGGMMGDIKPGEAALVGSAAISVAGVVAGHVALFRIGRSQGKLKGRGTAFAALGMSYFLLRFLLPSLFAYWFKRQ